MRMAPVSIARWLLGPEPPDQPGHLWPRWLSLRALALIFFSAFYSLSFQIQGLIGPQGILPAGEYLRRWVEHFGAISYWHAPTLLWLGSDPLALKLLCWTGLVASTLLTLNIWPRGTVAICLVAFLSFVSAAQDFSSYQSDGMLLAAGFLCLFFAPPGLRPGLGEHHPPSRASLFLLRWLCFRIYFESGIVKLASGDPQWRDLSALDHYYENGPLPNWIGWYIQQLPHWFHAAVAFLTLAAELGVVWMFFLPRRFRILCFFILTPFQIGIILTANLAFLNHLVLVLGLLLLDDLFLRGIAHRIFPKGLAWLRLAPRVQPTPKGAQPSKLAGIEIGSSPQGWLASLWARVAVDPGFRHLVSFVRMWTSGILLGWVFYVTTAFLLLMLFPRLPLPVTPIVALEPFRIANQYGLFAVMTTARYEIEFQGTRDGEMWIPYPFLYKPQDPRQPPRFYAPYQPRFDWNLWFASLGHWRQYFFVVHTEIRLLENSPSVLTLFASNPFQGAPPRRVRAVIWQYWFTDLATKRAQGVWWRRELRGLYAPTLEREPNGDIMVVQLPDLAAPLPSTKQ